MEALLWNLSFQSVGVNLDMHCKKAPGLFQPHF